MNDGICISVNSWAEAVRKRWMDAESQSAVNTLQKLFLGEMEIRQCRKRNRYTLQPVCTAKVSQWGFRAMGDTMRHRRSAGLLSCG